MIDPVVSLLSFSVSMGTAPDVAGPAALDPGPSAECPSDMRLVVGTHHDDVLHYCVAPDEDARDTHCYAYWEGITGLEGDTTAVRVCVDQFEAPNKRGAKPLTMKSFNMAKRWCKDRGKRVCTEQEWETACEGPHYYPLAYGWKVDRRVCNSDKRWKPVDFDKFAQGDEAANEEAERLWQGSPSGRFAGCVSPFGVYDMMGNVEEWVATRNGRKYPGALKGGFWAKPWTGCRGTNDAHEPSFVFYETGFRCCADPKPAGQVGPR